MTNRCPTSDFYPQYDSTVATNGPEAQKVTFPSDPLTSPRERSPKLDLIDRQLAPRGYEAWMAFKKRSTPKTVISSGT